MYFLEIDDSCVTLLGIIYFLRELIKIIFILIPVFLVLMLTFDLVKGTISVKDSNSSTFKIVSKRLINAGLVFLTPYLVFATFDVVGIGISDSSSCWTYAGEQNTDTVKKLLKEKEEALQAKVADKINRTPVTIVKSVKRVLTAPTVSSGTGSTTPTAGSNGYIFLINPSHQVHNSTKSSKSDYNTEKKSMYILANKVKSVAESNGYTVFITTENDGKEKYNTAQTDEAKSAAQSYGDKVVYLALHSNASGTSSKLWGPQLYYYGSKTASKNISQSLCTSLTAIYTKYKSGTKLVNCMNDRNDLKEVKYYYNSGGGGSATLAEVGFHDHTAGQKFIEDYGDDFANAIVEGINKHLNITPTASSSQTTSSSSSQETQGMTVSHTGFTSSTTPANTEGAFEAAGKAGIKMVEADVRMSSDNVLVLSHDSKVGGKKISSTPYKELSKTKVDNSSQTVCSLEKLFEISKKYSFTVMLDLKVYDDKFLNNLAKVIQSKGMENNVIVQTDIVSLAKKIKAQLPNTRISYLTSQDNSSITETQIQEAKNNNCEIINVLHTKLTKDFVTKAHAAGLKVGGFTAHSQSVADKIRNTGADYVLVEGSSIK